VSLCRILRQYTRSLVMSLSLRYLSKTSLFSIQQLLVIFGDLLVNCYARVECLASQVRNGMALAQPQIAVPCPSLCPLSVWHGSGDGTILAIIVSPFRLSSLSCCNPLWGLSVCLPCPCCNNPMSSGLAIRAYLLHQSLHARSPRLCLS
jgi:hypothetical protein